MTVPEAKTRTPGAEQVVIEDFGDNTGLYRDGSFIGVILTNEKGEKVLLHVPEENVLTHADLGVVTSDILDHSICEE